MKIEVLCFEGCPNHIPAMEIVRKTLDSLGRRDEIHQVEIHTQAEAQAIGFLGSPSIRINGFAIEPWARTAKEFGLRCRTYGQRLALRRCSTSRTASAFNIGGHS